ncbi:hypothetical protein A0J61_09595, partial [Choanephora cucurbitarum]
MPPSRGRRSTLSHLTPEEILRLSQLFETHRSNFSCMQCHATGTLHRNGHSTGNPPQPSFICKQCSKTHNARTVFETLTKPSQPTDTNDSHSMEISSSFPLTQQSHGDSVETLRALVLQLQEELNRTKAELQQARS